MVAVTCTAPATEEVVTYGDAETAAPAEEPAAADSAQDAKPRRDQRPPASPDHAVASPQPVAPSSTTVADRPTPAFAERARLGAGSLARVYLQPEPAERLAVEFLEQSGAAARSVTVDHLVGTLMDVSSKQVLDGGRWPLPDDRRVWSAEAINATVDEGARVDHESDLAVLHVLFLRGSFDQSASVLGVATRADTIAVFVDRIEDAATALVSRADIEPAVAVHELGHILGLVDLVVDTGRADPEHPGHSRNRGSVMYWAVESGLVTQVLSGGPPREFDDDDRRDLRSLRSGA